MSSRVLAVAVVVAALFLTGCNTTVRGSGALSGVPSGGPSPAPSTPSRAPESSASPDATPAPEVAVFEMGETGTVTDEMGNPLADITVADAVQTPDPPDTFSDPPAAGTFLSVTVTVATFGEDVFTVAPLDFLVRYPDETMIQYGEGSTGAFGYDNLLNLTDVEPGETITGVVVFDVDPAVSGKQVVYSDLAGRVLGAWNVP